MSPGDSTFEQLRLHNPIVARVMDAGGTAEDCAIVLVYQNQLLIHRLIHMEGICPRRIRLPGGRELIWRCPDELVPGIEGCAP